MTSKNFIPCMICVIAAMIFLSPVPGFTGQDKGRADVSLFGGKSGPVAFPHRLHQTVIKDCQSCHKDFAQKEGALEAAKKAAVLKKKQVMNKTCLKCHRALKKAGEKSGPTSCKKCHTK